MQTEAASGALILLSVVRKLQSLGFQIMDEGLAFSFYNAEEDLFVFAGKDNEIVEPLIPYKALQNSNRLILRCRKN